MGDLNLSRIMPSAWALYIYATSLTTSQPNDRSESSDPFQNVYYNAKDHPLKLTRK